MATIKEFREFFLRHSQVNSGSKKDQEKNFPTQYDLETPTGLKKVFNRFLKGDFPSESVMKKFLESITFKKNLEDSATTTQQGLVRVATDNEAISNTNNDSSTDFTNVVQPNQIPKIVSSITGDDTVASQFYSNGIRVTTLTRTITGKSQKCWLLESSDTVPIGAMIGWANNNTLPHGYLYTNGQIISRTAYADLFTIIGDTFGVGDGSTTFELPTFAKDWGGSIGSRYYIIRYDAKHDTETGS